MNPLLWLVGLFGSFLPARLRDRTELSGLSLPTFTWISGVLEILGSIYVLAFHGFRYIAAQDLALADGNLDRHQRSVFTIAGLVAFLLFTPAGWLCTGLMLEGIARTVAGVAGQSMGNVLLAGADYLLHRRERSLAKAAAGPVVADELRVFPPDRAEIWSCRLRGWDDLTTIAIDDVHYRVESMNEREFGLRRYVYQLGPLPRGWVLRKLVQYSPSLILSELGPKRS
ncbi:MAG: hypothetical protein U1E65_02025 [Myxococcota bacterium]